MNHRADTAVLFVCLQLLAYSASATGDENKAFADKALSAIFSEDEKVYRSLVHPKMDQCVNRIWNKKSGGPPTDYSYKISEVTEQTMNNANMGARMVGLKNPSFPVQPTHQIELSWTEESEHPPGHPCFSEMRHTYPLTLVRESGKWWVAPICVNEVEANRLVEERRRSAKSSKERISTADKLYSNLSTQQLADFQDLLLGIKVKAIYAYSEQLGVDMTTAYSVWNKMCDEYSEEASD